MREGLREERKKKKVRANKMKLSLGRHVLGTFSFRSQLPAPRPGMADDDDDDFATAMPPTGRLALRPLGQLLLLQQQEQQGQAQAQQQGSPTPPRPAAQCAPPAPAPPPAQAVPPPTLSGRNSQEDGASDPGPSDAAGAWAAFTRAHLSNFFFGRAQTRLFPCAHLTPTRLLHRLRQEGRRMPDLPGTLHARRPPPGGRPQRVRPPVWPGVRPARRQDSWPVPTLRCQGQAGRRADPLPRGRPGRGR